jgi:hypothetical protein
VATGIGTSKYNTIWTQPAQCQLGRLVLFLSPRNFRLVSTTRQRNPIQMRKNPGPNECASIMIMMAMMATTEPDVYILPFLHSNGGWHSVLL